MIRGPQQLEEPVAIGVTDSQVNLCYVQLIIRFVPPLARAQDH